MLILAAGFALWCAGHFLPSALPGVRERLIDAIGEGPYKGVFSLDAALAIVLMVIGYQRAAFIPVYDPPAWGVHLNNLMMLVAVWLFAVGGAKAWIATRLRHPMLTGVAVWGLSHLLVNGDSASILLFGGMLLWSLGMMWMINRRSAGWAPPRWGGWGAEAKAALLSLGVFAVIVFAHGWLFGVSPFPM